MPFQIIRNDITKVTADAIVNTANPHPVIGAGTDSAVYKAAGAERLLAERKKIGDIDAGKAAVTPAFDLRAKYIIHTVQGKSVESRRVIMQKHCISPHSDRSIWIPERYCDRDRYI